MENDLPKEKSDIVIQLENIFTIDGRGRPAKCKKFLELFNTMSQAELLAEIEIMSQRKYF